MKLVFVAMLAIVLAVVIVIVLAIAGLIVAVWKILNAPDDVIEEEYHV